MGQTKSILNKTNKIPEYTARMVLDCRNVHGECPIWDDRHQKLYWIDILDQKFWKYDPITQQSSSHSLPDRPGSFALCQFNDYHILFAFKSGPRFLQIAEDPFSDVYPYNNPIFEFEPDLPTMMTDGRVDRQGRFVMGGYNIMKGNDKNKPISNIYRLNSDLSHQVIIQGVAATNSICFSLDGKTMYMTDSRFPDGQKIMQYEYYEDEKKLPANSKMFTKWMDEEKYTNDENGNRCSIDGSIIDQDGYLWNAEFNGGRVVRYDENGNVNMIVNVPEPYVTCATFGGKDLDMLYVTTSSARMSDEEKNKYEHFGALYAVKLPVKGCKENRFDDSQKQPSP